MTQAAAPRAVTDGDDDFDFSPSAYHQRLIRRAPLRLSFANANGADDVAAWQRKLRSKIRELLAIPPNHHKPTRPRTLWRRETGLGVIDKLVFTAEPGADVPAYWCVPHGAERPYTAFVCVQGHSTGMHVSIAVEREDETKPRAIEGDRDFALGCMRRGIAALCIEQRSFGYRRERRQKHVAPHGCHDAVLRAAFLGRTLIGERVFDVDRGLDYLAERGDVDMRRVGVLGNSGGGVTTMYSAALLPRVRYAIPSCSFGSFAGTYCSIYHCGCNVVPGALDWFDCPDAMGLIAPRPLVIVAGETDDIYPIDDARKSFKQVQKIYRAAGAPDRVKFVVGREGHRFYADLAWAQMSKLM
jgi:dienelactone hydrolase